MPENVIFSDFFLDLIAIKPKGAASATACECVGSLEETISTKTITKKCRGRVKKSRTKGDTGTVKITMHMPYALYLSMYGMDDVPLAEGVHGYGPASTHKECVVTARVKDEDDVIKYKAWPCATVSSDKVTKVNDDDTEVAMVELELAVTPDDNDLVSYEALADGISEDLASKWMEQWTPELVAATA